MSKILPLVFVATAAFGASVFAQQPTQPGQAVGPAAIETDPDYILDAAFSEGAYRLGPRVTNPSVIREFKPVYTSEAMRERLEGEVAMAIRIGVNGTVEAVRVRKSLDRGGLDVEAMRAALQWLFKPATIDGKAVPVIADLVLSFNVSEKAAAR